MPFEQIESAINLCREHLESLDEEDIHSKEIEIYLVAGIVVLIISSYEAYLEGLFNSRASQCGDPQVANYIRNAIARYFRSPDISKINDILKRFDSVLKETFFSDIENTASHAAWDSIMKARHAVVHQQGQLNLTFLELEKAYPLTKQVINKLKTVLNC